MGTSAMGVETYRRVDAAHEHWRGALMLAEHSDRLVHEQSGNAGRYICYADFLFVAWDAFPTELFVRQGDIYVQCQSSMPDISNLRRVQVQGKLFDLREICVTVSQGVQVSLRVGTTDIPTFKQMFAELQYESDYLPDEAKSVLDLGANIGLASVFFATKYSTATILSVEPQVDNFKMLVRNIAPFASRVVPLHGAAWCSDGQINMHTRDGEGKELGSWGVQVSEQATNETVSIPCYSVGALVRQIGFQTVDILKIDIEGAELDLFSRGDLGWIERVRLIMVETHDRFRAGSESAVRGALYGRFEELPQSGENLLFRRIESGR